MNIVMSNNTRDYLHVEITLNDEQLKYLIDNMKILNETDPERVKINSIFFDKHTLESIVKFKK